MKMSLLFNDKMSAPLLFATSIAANLSFLLLTRSASSLSSRLPKGPPTGKRLLLHRILFVYYHVYQLHV